MDRPPAVDIGDDVQASVGTPGWLGQRGAVAQNPVGARHGIAVAQVDQMQARVIPRHVRVIPAEICQPRPVRRGPWRGIEVGTGGHHADRAVQADRYQLVARLRPRGVVGLAHPHADGIDSRSAGAALRRRHQRWVGVPQSPRDGRLRGHRTRRGLPGRVEQPHPVVAHAAGQHKVAAIGCFVRQPGAAAVFVDGGADVCFRRIGKVDGPRTGVVKVHPHHGASSMVKGPFLHPIGPTAGGARLSPSHSTCGDVGRMQW